MKKNRNLLPISRFISEIIQDRAVVRHYANSNSCAIYEMTPFLMTCPLVTLSDLVIYSVIRSIWVCHIAETAADRARASYLLPLGVAAVIAISVVLLIVILIVIDVSCYFINSCGVTMVICTRLCGKSPALSKEKTAEEGERYDFSYLQSSYNQSTYLSSQPTYCVCWP